jgi:uncharacterized protein (TIGR03437 family)
MAPKAHGRRIAKADRINWGVTSKEIRILILFAVQTKSYVRSVAAGAVLLAGCGLCAQTITTVAGTGVNGYTADGSAATATQLNSPSNVAFDSSGNLYISDSGNFRVRKVTGGTVSTYAGDGTPGHSPDGKSATAVEIDGVFGLNFDTSGNLYLADTGSSCIREVAPGGAISTPAGECGVSGFIGDGAAATSANISDPAYVLLDAAGDEYIADGANNRVRLVTKSTGFISTFAGLGGAMLSGDGGTAVQANLYSPRGLALDSAGNLYIADADNNAVRMVTVGGIITTIANASANPGFSGDGGPATAALLSLASGVAVDAAGNVFIADDINCRVRKVDTNGIITTIAGSGAFGFAGDGGPAVSASLLFPTGVALDSSGNLYISDSGNGAVRKVTNVGVPALKTAPAIGTGGVISSSGFGAATSIAPGSFIEIYGSNLGVDTNLWSGRNFISGLAPTWLDGTAVTIGGIPAYVVYVSPNQINALVPFNVPTGASEPVIVTNSGGVSAAANVTINALQPGLLATGPFNIGGTQYAVALLPDFATYILPVGAISGVTSRPAKAGDTIVLFGTGFGPVSTGIAAGQIVTQANSLVNPVQFSIGGVAATTSYQGLGPGEAGVYQFDIVVPAGVPNGNAALTFTQANGGSGTQTLYVAIQN